MNFLNRLLNVGTKSTDSSSERKTTQLTNAIALILASSIALLLLVRWTFFGVPIWLDLLVTGLIFLTPIALNYGGYVQVSRIFICWIPTLSVYYFFITRLWGAENVGIDQYDAMKIYLLGFSAFPFLLLRTHNRFLFIAGISLPMMGVMLCDPLMDLFMVGPFVKGADVMNSNLNWMRTVISNVVLSGSCFALRSVVDHNENLSEKRYRELFEINPVPMVVVEEETLQILDVNNAAKQLYGFKRSEFLERTLKDITEPQDARYLPLLVKPQVTKLAKVDRIWRHAKKNGDPIEAELTGHVLERKGNNAIMVMVNDVTNKQATDRQLKQLVVEKEVLIKEIHHRVKNNLQLISSIIHLKAMGVNDVELKEFLTSILQKIKSVSFIHERLQQTSEIHRVDIAAYLQTLINDFESTLTPTTKISFRTSFASALFPIDTAIYLGLTVNELATNALKHAFRHQTNGWIQISLTPIGDHYTLLVANNGSTLPENADVREGERKSMGMQLIDVFVQHLKGRLEIKREPVTQFALIFSKPE